MSSSRPQWMFNPPMGAAMPGAPVQVGAGGGFNGGAQAMSFRDPLDAARAGMGRNRIPSAEYPDGYLGNLKSRREDRLLQGIKDIVNKRAYTRGVHAGEKIEPDDYILPPEFAWDSGLRRQAQGRPTAEGTWAVQRQAPLYTVYEQLQANPHGLPRGAESLVTLQLNPSQSQQVAHLSPRWR